MERMRGLWLEDQQIQYRTDLPVAEPQEGEALVKVSTAGICSTDLQMLRGYYPFTGVPGHEFVGEVVALNSTVGGGGWVGSRVVGEITLSCGDCPACRRGDMGHCEQRNVLGLLGRNGAFAEYLTLPLKNLHRIPAGVSDEAAVFVEPLAAALEIQEQVKIGPGQHVLVIGAGRLGQLVAQTLALTDCRLQVAARHPQQRALLAERKIEYIAEEDIPARKVDIVVEATGSRSGWELASKAVRPRGTIVLKSTYHGDITLNLSGVVVDEVTIVGSRCGPFAPAVRLLADGQVDPVPLIAGRFSLEQGQAAYAAASQRGMLKVLFTAI